MLPVYHLNLFVNRCIVEVTVNGLYLFRTDAKNGYCMNCPLNTELVGKNNAIAITLLPTILESGKLSDLSDFVIQGEIKKYMADEVACPENGEQLITLDFSDIFSSHQNTDANIADLANLYPLKKTFLFDNDTLNFGDRLVTSQVISDQKVLIDYAVRIRDILKNQDINKLYEEYKPKLDDYTIAYPSEFPDPKEWFLTFFRDDFFPGGPVTEFEKDDIGVRSWCDGRVWEIFIKPYQPFFLNKGIDGDINSIEMFVGMVGGQLRIVR